MNIITSIGEGLGKLFHGKKAAQVTTAATSELPKVVAAEIQEAAEKMELRNLSTDVIDLGFKKELRNPSTDVIDISIPKQDSASIMEKIQGLKGFRLDDLKVHAQEGSVSQTEALINLQKALGDGYRVGIKKHVSASDYLRAIDELGIRN